MEGIRLNGTFASYREAKIHDTINDGGKQVRVKPGDKIFCSFVQANREPEYFPDPDTVRLDRPLDSYIHYGVGPHACLGRDASRVALTAMLKVVGRLDNLRRAPGPQGEMKKIPRPGGFYTYMRGDWGGYWPFPTSEWRIFLSISGLETGMSGLTNELCSDESMLGRRAAGFEEVSGNWVLGGGTGMGRIGKDWVRPKQPSLETAYTPFLHDFG